jgi:hypothetical protein
MKNFTRLLAVLGIAALASAAAATASPSRQAAADGSAALNCKSTLKIAFLTRATRASSARSS